MEIVNNHIYLSVLVLMIGLAIAYWQYLIPKEKKSSIRKVLFGLRTATFLVLAILLLNIYNNHFEEKTKKPLVIVNIDDSRSMLNYADSLAIKKDLQNILTNAQEQHPDFEFTTQALLNNGVSDSLSFSGTETNLGTAFKKYTETTQAAPIAAQVLISDGNHNTDITPLSYTDALNDVPVYTLGVGQANAVRDLVIKEVKHNKVVRHQSLFQVEIGIQASLAKGKKSKLIVAKKRGVLFEKELFFNTDEELLTIQTFLEADSLGILAYSVSLEDIPDEASYDNNVRQFFVESVKDINPILVLASAPNPDIRLLKDVIEANEANEVEVSLMKNFKEELSKNKLIILHGVDRKYTPLYDRVIASGIPYMVFVNERTDLKILNKLFPGADFKKSRNTTEDVQVSYNEEYQGFELALTHQEIIQEMPALKTPFLNWNANLFQAIAYQKVAGIVKTTPLIAIQQNDKNQNGLFLTQNLWRWRFAENQVTGNFDAIAELLQKTMSTCMTNRKDNRLRIETANEYNQYQSIKIEGFFTDESGALSTRFPLNLKLQSATGPAVDYTFSASGNSYRLELGKLNPGTYSYTANLNDGKTVFGKSGRFTVSDFDIETDIKSANHALLTELSTRSKGVFLKGVDKLPALMDSLQRRNTVKATIYPIEEYSSIFNYLWLLLLAVSFLITEWILRKREGLV